MKQTILFALFLVGGVMAFGQNPLVKQWDKRFGGDNHDYLSSFQQTLDRGYILAGFTYSDSIDDVSQNSSDYGIPHCDYWIIKIDSLGGKQWDKKFGGTSSDVLHSIQQTKDKGYILGGNTRSDSSGDVSQHLKGGYDYWIVKTDSIGNKLWDKRFGGNAEDYLKEVQQTKDGGFVLAGITISNSNGDVTQLPKGGYDYWIVKTDSLGNKIWDKRFGGNMNDLLSSFLQTNDGCYILGGYTLSDSSGDLSEHIRGVSDYWLLKIDPLGNKIWDKTFGGDSSDELYSMQPTKDGGFIIGGISTSKISGDVSEDGSGKGDYWIIKIDSLYSKQWDKKFGGSDNERIFTSVKQTKDRGYLLSGISPSNISGDKTETNLGIEQVWLVKTDDIGNKQWDKTLLTTGQHEYGYAIQSDDGCYEVANYTDAGIGGYKTQANWDTTNATTDYWLIKFCDTSNITSVSSFSLLEEPQVKIYPNPANSQLFIETNGEEIKQVNIYNTMGEVVMGAQQIINHQSSIFQPEFT
ncbi:MAG: T9SS type A sorting domain-containing protein [Bacteroidetes bacterium]|nr:T9SS type A sorting domain-containing protein [Bacteroidota bacterium]